jgi:DNA-binding NarL/FixJ family response regulator
VQKLGKLEWKDGRLVIEIEATIRVPIEMQPILQSVASNVQLTKRETETLRWLIQGKSNKEIAYELHLSERTVKFHVSSLLQKFGVRGRMEVANLFPNGLKTDDE